MKPVLLSIFVSDLCTITGRLTMKMTPTHESTKEKPEFYGSFRKAKSEKTRNGTRFKINPCSKRGSSPVNN